MQLRDLPYGLGSLDAIIDWVNDPDPLTPRVDAFWASRDWQVVNRTSGGIQVSAYGASDDLVFLCSRQSVEPRTLPIFFTTLAIDLCNRYPAFKTSLGNVISNNRELVSAESLIQDPLNYVHFVGSVFVVIDALDGCEDASSSGFRAGGNTLLCFPCAPPIRTTLEFLHNHYVSSRGRLHSPRRHLPAYCRWTTASWQLPWMKTFSPTCMQGFARLSLTSTVPSW